MNPLLHQRIGDLTVEQFLAVNLAWGTGMWILITAATLAIAWWWKRRQLGKAVAAAAAMAAEVAPPTFEDCGALDPAAPACGPCVMMKGHAGEHYSAHHWAELITPVGNMNDLLEGGG